MTRLASLDARVQALRQLLRLRRLHEEAARRQRDAQEATLAVVRRAEQARQQRIQDLVLQRTELSAWWAGAAVPALARWQSAVLAHGARIDDALERAVFGLIDDQRAVADAQREFDLCQQASRRASARVQAVELMLEQAQGRWSREAEHAAERQAEAPARRLPVLPVDRAR